MVVSLWKYDSGISRFLSTTKQGETREKAEHPIFAKGENNVIQKLYIWHSLKYNMLVISA